MRSLVLGAALLAGGYQLSAISHSVDTAGSTRHAPLATHSLSATHHSPPTRKHRFTIARGKFLLDGRPFQILSGELHYARIPREYWASRLAMAKAMGLNAITTYVFWNFHETRPGHFDFSTGERDLGAFIDEAKKQGLWVILRPGPYVCAEWDFGGYPSYLARDTSLKVRTRDPRFLAAEKRYIRALAKVITPRLVTHGGPVVLVQVENEYG
ncbi:MAG TPA: beta-galactosidase, partial [Gemmatimonadales bacterium]|nr:beta-galactosidase [Gemmatimonadales bacterium]